MCKQLIINALDTMGRASAGELKDVLLGLLSAVLNDKQQSKKVYNIFQAMKREGIADNGSVVKTKI
ncbi:MAG TPA: hypothetical protein DCX57_07425 [Lachnospiraceae bacterium]|nr:hypothetical protein [Lachnospiraceae bacterium]